MREITTPALAEIGAQRNVSDFLRLRVAEAPEHPAFDVREAVDGVDTAWRQVTTAEFEARVREVAKGLIAAGVRAGDRVAILSPTRYEWAIADLASWYAGAVVVPVYDSSAPSQVTAIAADAGVSIGFAGTPEHVAILEQAFTGGVGALGVYSLVADDSGRSGLDVLAELGREVDEEQLDRQRLTPGLDDPATIVYTSGTTGEPKGAILTHGNFVHQVLNTAVAYGEVVNERGSTVIFLPLAHVLARALQLICLAKGMRIAHLSSPTEVVASLAVLRPTFLVVVPRVLEKIRGAAAGKAAEKGLEKVWASAEATAVAVGRHREEQDAGRTHSLGFGTRLRHRLFDRLFYGRLRGVMGGRMQYMLAGGAHLDAELSLFFRGLGVPVIEGYGLTETTAPLTGNLPGSIVSGTVGIPLPGSSVRISDEGEVLGKGFGIFSGYRNPEHTAEAFVDGWFRTGDLGHLDEDGRLILDGRLKEVVVTSNGKTFVPAAWEHALEAEALVSHAVVVGEGQPYLSALLLLDPLEASAWGKANGVEVPAAGEGIVEVTDSTLLELIGKAVEKANALVARSEHIRKFRLLIADLEDRGIVTPTLKLRKSVVVERAADTVRAIYG